jgi:hypothetical protein
MRRLLSLVSLVVALLAVTPGTAFAGGRGDNFNRPIVIGSAPYTNVHKNIKGAKTQDGEPATGCGSGTVYHSIWYTFTPPSTANYVLDTEGSNFGDTSTANDTMLAVYTRSGNDFTGVACDDDSGSDNTSSLNISLGGGTTYYIAAGAYSADYYGQLVFNLAVA